MSLCPEHDERAAMTDAEFWDRVARNLGVNTDPDDVSEIDPAVQRNPCPVCGSMTECASDAEGRPLIHALEDVDE